jgi:drug/metabolite transporter (DMT)-like permease
MDEVELLKSGKKLFERGILIALVAAVLSACANYSIGATAQQVSPLMAIWYSHAVIGFICLVGLLIKGQLKETLHDFHAHPYLITGQSVCDNGAWIGYAYAVTYLPISLVITISESYIILAALLGYWIGGERLHIHQKIGAAVALPAVILFAALQ